MKKLRHVVLFCFKAEVSDQKVAEVNRAFGELKQSVQELNDFEMGTNNSPEGIARGYTHAYLLTFLSEEDRAVYLQHPAHKAFQQLADPTLDQVLAFDYWAQ